MKNILCLVAFAFVSMSYAHAQFGGMHFPAPTPAIHTTPAIHSQSVPKAGGSELPKGNIAPKSPNTTVQPNTGTTDVFPTEPVKKKKKKKKEAVDSDPNRATW